MSACLIMWSEKRCLPILWGLCCHIWCSLYKFHSVHHVECTSCVIWSTFYPFWSLKDLYLAYCSWKLFKIILLEMSGSCKCRSINMNVISLSIIQVGKKVTGRLNELFHVIHTIKRLDVTSYNISLLTPWCLQWLIRNSYSAVICESCPVVFVSWLCHFTANDKMHPKRQSCQPD